MAGVGASATFGRAIMDKSTVPPLAFGREVHHGREFRVELVWKDDDHNAASSLCPTTDGRVIVDGRAIPPSARSSNCRWRPR